MTETKLPKGFSGPATSHFVRKNCWTCPCMKQFDTREEFNAHVFSGDCPSISVLMRWRSWG